MRTKKKAAARKAAPWWQVVHIKGTPAAPIGGRVQAPDQETAINLAAELYGITDPIKRSRLGAYRVS